MGQLELVFEQIFPDDTDIVPANHRAQDLHQGAFTPTCITRQHEGRLTVVYTFEDL